MRFLVRCFLFFLFLILFIFPRQTFAAENFTTKYNVVYSVSESATTRATFSIQLVNTTEQYYASSYKMQLGFDDITNLTARDSKGALKPVLTKTDEGQTVALTFNDRVIGKGEVLSFSLSFDTPNVARKNGSVWEINIPGIRDRSDFSSFTAEVKVPESFGKPTYIKPQQANNSLIFSKEQLENSGISIAFGSDQTYGFSLTYHLQNANVFPIKTEIAIPPTTNYQKVYIKNIIPKPTNVKQDADGNWLAEYTLLPSQKKDVKVLGQVALSLTPEKSPMSDEALKAYLKEQPYWQVEHEKIQALAKSHNTPEAIYKYVVKTLTYDFSRVSANQERLGALQVSTKPNSAVCLEFTDLFVAIARAAGIPAREVNGYAFTENSRQRPLSLVADILHAWPEYYDRERERWVMVDPTWGNTTGGVDYFHTLDFDHFVFVKKGLNSEYPIPAGGYKLPGDEEKKDVHVEFAVFSGSEENTSEITSDMKETYFSGTPVKGKIYIKNIGQTISPETSLTLQAGLLTPRMQRLSVGQIPPFGFVSIPFTYDRTSLLTNTKDTLTMRIAGSTHRQEVLITPFLITRETLFLGGGILGIFTIIILIITIKTRRVRVSQ